MKALKDPDERVRSSAAQALGAIGDNRAYNALIVAVKDKDDLVRSAAIRSLGELGDTRAFDILAKMADNGEKPTDAVAAADALATMGDPRAYPHIVPLLYLSDPVMGASVASALARIGDKRAVRPLIGAIQKGWVVREGTLVCGCEEPFRDAAAEALMEMNDAEGNAFLLSALKQGDLAVVQGASRFFISQGVPGSEQTLLKVLNSTGMAEDFARCGNPVLSEAGKAWLYDHPDVQGTYDDVPDTSPVQWGSKTGM
jgi:HEAT repeat protein